MIHVNTSWIILMSVRGEKVNKAVTEKSLTQKEDNNNCNKAYRKINDDRLLNLNHRPSGFGRSGIMEHEAKRLVSTEVAVPV